MTVSLAPPAVPEWIPPKPTEEQVEWANILTVDLSLYDTKKDELIDTVATALQRDGFFYVVGHGIDLETVSDRTVLTLWRLIAKIGLCLML